MNPAAEQIKLASQPYVEALTAMCIVGRDGDYHVQNPEWIYSKRSFMRNMLTHWGVGSSDELKKNIEWSIATGQRKEFDDMALLLSSLSETDRRRYLESQKGDTAQSFKLSIVNSYLGRMPAGGIAANDYTWAVFKCCAGHKMDYLTEDEKWTYIGDIIQLVKNQYSNWKDYLISFTVGGAFNSTLQSSDYIGENQAIITKLLVSDYSPLRQAILK